jgi:hypothetical protein
MKCNRFPQFAIGLFCGAFLLFNPAQISAQDIKNAQEKCAVTSYEPEKATLPVALTEQEYKAYCDIMALGSPEDLIAQGQIFLESYKKSELRFPVYQNLVTSAIRLNNFDLAFELGRKALAEYPGHVLVMTQLSTVAGNVMLMGDNKFADEGRGYACKALSFILNDQMPHGYTLERWRPYRDGLLGDIYQALGIFELLNDCPEDSIKALAEAAKFAPAQPYNYFLIAKAQVRLYQWGERGAFKCRLPILPGAKQPETLLEEIARTYAFASILTETEHYKLLNEAISYDIKILSDALGAKLKDEFARSIEAVRTELEASIVKQPATATVRP